MMSTQVRKRRNSCKHKKKFLQAQKGNSRQLLCAVLCCCIIQVMADCVICELTRACPGLSIRMQCTLKPLSLAIRSYTLLYFSWNAFASRADWTSIPSATQMITSSYSWRSDGVTHRKKVLKLLQLPTSPLPAWFPHRLGLKSWIWNQRTGMISGLHVLKILWKRRIRLRVKICSAPPILTAPIFRPL